MNNNTHLNGKLIIALSRGLQEAHKASEILFYQNDITISQFMVLEALYHKGDLSIKQIINALLSSSGNITVVIRNLEKQGLVERLSSQTDKRSFLIRLTDTGRKRIEPLYTEHMERVATALSPITEQEKEQMIAILKKLSQKEDTK